MTTLAKPQIWYPGANVQHPLCLDFQWNFWEGVGARVGCVGKRVGRPDQYGATLVNDPTWAGSPYGSVVNHDGSDQYADIDCPAVITKDDPFTLILLAKSLVDAADYQALTAIHDGSAGFFLAYFRNADNGLTFRLWHGATETEYEPAVAIDETIWHQYAFVSNGSAITLYIDGIETATASSTNLTAPNVSGKLLFGRAYSTVYGNISLADAKLHSSALSATEIKDIYADTWAAFRLRRMQWPVAAAEAVDRGIWHSQHDDTFAVGAWA